MTGDVSLSSIEFSSAYNPIHLAISSVRCTLSNGQESPLYIVEGEKQQKPKVINFSADRKVNWVQAEDGVNYVKRVTIVCVIVRSHSSIKKARKSMPTTQRTTREGEPYTTSEKTKSSSEFTETSATKLVNGVSKVSASLSR